MNELQQRLFELLVIVTTDFKRGFEISDEDELAVVRALSHKFYATYEGPKSLNEIDRVARTFKIID